MAESRATDQDRSDGSPDSDLVIELSDMAGFDRMLAAVTSLLERTTFTERQVKDVRQAIAEMAGNALEWGQAEGQERWARVSCRVGPEDVTAIVTDRGPGFDTSFRYDSSDPESFLEHAPKGFGIMLARGLVDVFSYNDKGNEVTLVKRFGPETH